MSSFCINLNISYSSIYLYGTWLIWFMLSIKILYEVSALISKERMICDLKLKSCETMR